MREIFNNIWSRFFHTQTPRNSLTTAGDSQLPLPDELTQSAAQETFLTYYKNGDHPGAAVIYNFQKFKWNSYRSGSEHDVANLEFLFKRMELTIFKYENLSRKEFLTSLKTFSKYKGHKKGSMIFVAILSHGNHNSIETYDGKLVNLDMDVYPLFYHDACPDLIKKPKNFIIQCCRGDQEQDLVNSSTNGVSTIPNVSDISIVYSTIPLHVSYRNSSTGSWLISSYCEIIGEYGNDYDYETLTMKVSQQVQERSNNGRRMTIERTFRGFDCYLQLKLLDPKELHEREEKRSWRRRLVLNWPTRRTA